MSEPTGVPRYYIIYKVRGVEARTGPYNMGEELSYQLRDMTGWQDVEVVGTLQEERCCGFLDVCDNPPDLSLTIEDPRGQDGPKIYRCAQCAVQQDALMDMIEASGKMEEFTREVEAAMEEEFGGKS